MLFSITSMKRVVMTACIFGVAACTASKKQQKKDGEPLPASDEPFVAFTDSLPDSLIASTFSAKSNDETLWALSECDCVAKPFASFLERAATEKGVLPQILIPTVREEIKNNTALQTLQKIPLGGLLADFFAGDDKLAEKVRDGLEEKIKKSPGGSDLGERVAFRFDAFAPTPSKSDTFDVSGQLARWNAVVSASNFWEAGQPLDGIDHGLQALAVLRTLSEWKYMVGLDENSSGGFYGGIALKVADGQIKMIGPVDPRKGKKGDGSGFILSGSYTLSYDEKSSRDLATSVKEVWTHGPDGVSLDEQAKLWLVTAKAFERLRPKHRAPISSLFAAEKEDEVLPKEVHQLPLAFLSSLQVLLPGPFIEKDERLIRQYAALSDQDSDGAADLTSLARLIRGLSAWSLALSDLGDAALDANTLEKVQGVPDDLKPAIQLAVQTILNDHLLDARKVDGVYGLALVEAGKPVEISVAAEVLVAMMRAESSILSSEFLHTQICSILDWFAGDLLARSSGLNGEELLWVRTVAKEATRFDKAHVSTWAPDVLEKIDLVLKK